MGDSEDEKYIMAAPVGYHSNTANTRGLSFHQ